MTIRNGLGVKLCFESNITVGLLWRPNFVTRQVFQHNLFLQTKAYKTHLSKGLDQDNNIITLDIETGVNECGEHYPYLISYFDGELVKSFFLTDYNSSESMITDCLKSIINNPEYKGFSIYAHNLANFDSIFLINALVSSISGCKFTLVDLIIVNTSVKWCNFWLLSFLLL